MEHGRSIARLFKSRRSNVKRSCSGVLVFTLAFDRRHARTTVEFASTKSEMLCNDKIVRRQGVNIGAFEIDDVMRVRKDEEVLTEL